MKTCQNETMSPQLRTPTLEGTHVRLQALGLHHINDLTAAAQENRDTYGYTAVPENTSQTTEMVDHLLGEGSKGQCVPFAQVATKSGRAVGVTRYLTIRSVTGAAPPYAVEIGGTWLAGSAQHTSINTEAKLLLFTHAFETWEVARVDLKTDSRNERSRAAILRLGATFEGVLRQWQPSYVAGEESLFRDTAMYSVVSAQWPGVHRRLEDLLQ